MTSETQSHQDELEKAAFVLKTIAHPTRLAIIDLLSKKGRKTVSDICSVLELEQSLASHHLNTMKLKGVLGSTKEGKNKYYYLKLMEVTQIISCIDNCNLSFTIYD
ncbi:MAG: winged helix-turn-helix transcriptional regulator [Cyclobacteriaceae bacterium]|nr:winged helix-turn-helix transcriptional regulator [Cyclobacteriaceae bacterium]